MSSYPWYEEVPPDTPLTQGDIVESCPVLVFAEIPPLSGSLGVEELVKQLDEAHAVQFVRSIVMTQACDLAYGRVRNVILCPAYHLDEWKALWEERERRLNPAQLRSVNRWNGHTKQIKDGKIWNLTMLDTWASGAGSPTPHQVVDFHEVFSVPLEFLTAWLRAQGKPRVRLCPPYREHLSQAFARFFMRVGLPQDIAL